MRIGLISDTHGHFDDRMSHYLQGCDEVWHAGDVGSADVLTSMEQIAPLRGVYGNIDGTTIRGALPETLCFEVNGVRAAMIHIAGPFGKYNAQTRALIQGYQPSLLVCGHSHILKVQMDHRHRLLYINPGAAGKHGFHKVRTLCRFSLLNGKIEGLEIIELGPRSAQTIN